MARWLVFTVMLMMPGFTPAHELTRDQMSSFAKDGYLVVKGLCQNSQFTQLEQQVQKAIDGAWRLSADAAVERKITSEGTVYVFGPDFQSLLRIVWVGARYPKLLAMGRQPCLTVPVAQLLESRKASHLINQIHPKLPGDRVRFDLHRDVDHRRSFDPNWEDVKGNGSFVQTMVAIDPMTRENGGLFVFPGSHHDHKPVKGNPVLSREYASGKHGKPLLLQLSPGDTVFFHPYLVHFSEENRSNRARRAFINGFACPGANHVQYPGKGSGEVITLVK